MAEDFGSDATGVAGGSLLMLTPSSQCFFVAFAHGVCNGTGGAADLFTLADKGGAVLFWFMQYQSYLKMFMI